MPRQGVSLEEVASAVREIEARGERVTYLAVRRALGDTGSMSTIRAHIEAFRSQQNSVPREAREVPSDLAADLAQSASRFWDRAQESARRDVEIIRAAAQERAESLQKELDELCADYDVQADKLTQTQMSLESVLKQLHAVEQGLVATQAEKAELDRAYGTLIARFDAQTKAINRLMTKVQAGSSVVAAHTGTKK